MIVKTVAKNYQKYPKLLIFHGELEEKGKGQLLLIDTKTARIDARFLARSGIGGAETQKAKGPIPSNLISGFNHYQVSLKPLYLPQKGIEGNFYQISPFAFKVKGVTRADMGIHADRGNNGTLGCIGINESDWTHFQALAQSLEKAGLNKIPLLVSNY